MDERYDVSEALLRLIRTMRRRPRSPGQASPGHRRLLRMIAEHEASSSRELAQKLDIRPASLTGMLQKLEQRGEIIRVRDGKDSRVVRVSISAKGSAVLAARDAERKQSIDAFSRCLSDDERKQFCIICARLSRSFEQSMSADAAVQPDMNISENSEE